MVARSRSAYVIKKNDDYDDVVVRVKVRFASGDSAALILAASGSTRGCLRTIWNSTIGYLHVTMGLREYFRRYYMYSKILFETV